MANISQFIYNFSYQNSYLFDNNSGNFTTLCDNLFDKIIRLETYSDKFFNNTDTIDISILRKSFVLNNEDDLKMKSLLQSASEYEIERHKLLSFIKAYITNKPIKLILDLDTKIEAEKTEEVLRKSINRRFKS